MSRIDKLQKFLDSMNQYYDNINNMGKELPDISKYLHGLSFADDRDIKIWQENLRQLLDFKDRLRSSYMDAGLGEMTGSPKETLARATAVYEKLQSRQKYQLALDFVKELDSCDLKIKEKLAKLVQGLTDIDIEQIEDENVLASLDKYVYLQNAFQAKEKSDRFAELLKVGAEMDSELLFTVYERPELFSVSYLSGEANPELIKELHNEIEPKVSQIINNTIEATESSASEEITVSVIDTVAEETPLNTGTVTDNIGAEIEAEVAEVSPVTSHEAIDSQEVNAAPVTEEPEIDAEEILKHAFAYQHPSALIKVIPLKKETNGYTINKFKIEAKGENDAVINLIYRLLDKYGYVSLDSSDIPEAMKEEVKTVLEKHRKIGYLVRIVAANRCTFYYLAVKGSQAIKDSAFRNYVRLGKNLKRADIHTLRDFNDFNVASYVQLRDHIRAVGINQDTYDEKETVAKNCYTMSYRAKDPNKPDVRIIGFTEANTINLNSMQVRLENIAEGREILVVAGINAEVILTAFKWVKENLGRDNFKDQLYSYNVAEKIFATASFEAEFTDFKDIYAKFVQAVPEQEEVLAEEQTIENEQSANADSQAELVTDNIDSIEKSASDNIENVKEVYSEEVADDSDIENVPDDILITKEVYDAALALEPEVTAYPEKESKNSSAKEFKKLVLQSKIRGAIFSTGVNGYYIHPEIVSGYSEMPQKTCVFELDQLTNMGLLRKVAYESEEPYYILTPKAERLCKAETIRSLLKLDVRKAEPQVVYDNTHPLNVKYYLNALRYVTEATHYSKAIMKCKMANHHFIHLNKPAKDVINYACISGVYTDDAEAFKLYAKSLEELDNSIFIKIFAAVSHEQGKALMKWWKEKYPGFNDDALGYMLIDGKKIYAAKNEETYDRFEDFVLTLLDKLEKEITETEIEPDAIDVVVKVKSQKVKAETQEKKIVTTEPMKKAKAVQTVAESVPEEQEPEPENIVLENPDREAYRKNYEKMIAQGKIYAACAYLKVLDEKDKSFAPLYKQLAYAAGDPLGGCTYTSQVINEVFFNEVECDNNLLAAASLRNFFYDYNPYDYYIKQLMDMLKNCELIEKCQSLAVILQDISAFKDDFKTGMDRYADYHAAGTIDINKELGKLKYYISEQYNHYCVKFKEDVANKRFSEARKVVLEKDGPLGTFLKKALDGDESIGFVDQLRTFLAENYIADGALVRKENIDNAKIEKVIDAAWNKATEKLNSVIKTSDLMSALRTKFFNQIYRLVTPLCDYVALNDAKIPVDNPAASKSYGKLRTRLLQNIGDAKEYAYTAFHEGENSALVLAETLSVIEACLDGSYKAGSEKYFYLDFLKTDNVLLDDNYMPYLNDVDGELNSMSVLRRIEKHVSTKEEPLETRAQKILDAEDNYSSLNCILSYLETVNPGYEAKFIKDKSLKLSIENASAELDIYREEFENDIELRQSYGQIDETEGNPKEKLLKIVDIWYDWAKESQNYGFFHKICNALIEKIETDAVPRGKQLQSRLDKFVRDNPMRMEDGLVEEAVVTVKERIRIKNYAAAEDLLNRLYSDDDTLIPAKSVIETDYLQNFIRDFNACYQDVCNMRTNFKSLLLGRAPNNKDGKAANRLVENWMYQPELCTVERVTALLASLDFSVGSVVERKKIGNVKTFDVTLARPDDGRKVKHKHPIAAFGSMAETDPFRVAFVFGNYEADGILDIFNSLGDAQHTLLFMDGALTMGARRTLARKTKEITGKTFAVVDRVVLAFLHRNFRQAAVQKMLMSIIIPFAFCQPYVVDSFVMPPEIFIGREEELKQIESPDGVNIVYGGRQLGKSAMLRMAVNDVDKNERGDRAVYVDIANLDYKAACRKVAMVLNEDGILDEVDYTEDWGELSHRIRVRLKSDENRIPYLLLLLDEADEFIRTSAEVNYNPLENLKDIQGIGVGRFKFVFAGLRDVIRFDRNQALSNNSVMTKLSKLTVKPFNVNEARLLLEQPLGYLGLRFAKDEDTESLIASIFSATNYFPGLLQLYCANLVKALQKPDYAGYDEIDTPPYEVSVEHIKRVLGGKELQSQIRDKFFITLQLGENEDKYYYIIAHLIALQHHRDAENSDVTPEMLLDLAAEYAIKRITDLDEQKVYALMEELCELNILHTAGKGYRFTRYSFYQMMGSVEHIENELLQFLED